MASEIVFDGVTLIMKICSPDGSVVQEFKVSNAGDFDFGSVKICILDELDGKTYRLKCLNGVLSTEEVV